VLVVQTLRRRRFSRHEMRLLRAIAGQVGAIIVQARLLEDLKSKEKERREYRRRMVAAIKRLQTYEKTAERAETGARGRAHARLGGLPAVPGFGHGRVHLLQPPVSFALVEERRCDDLEAERERFWRAIAESAVELVGLRILRNLLGIEEPEHPLAKNSVLVAHELTLSDLSLVEHDHLCAIVLATGGVTSHATILAKSFEIPTVVGVEHLTETVHEGDELIVDGNSGVVYVNPAAEVTREYERIAREYRAFNRELEGIKSLPAETPDGRRVSMYANVGLLADLMFAHRHGAEGVGLYRTEFPFITYREFPDEEEQYQLYARLVRAMEGRPV